MALYQIKPEIVEAFQIGVDPIPEWFKYDVISIAHKIGENDVIVKKPDGEIICMTKEKFDKKYQLYFKKSNDLDEDEFYNL